MNRDSAQNLVEAVQLLGPGGRIGRQFPGRHDDVVAGREIAAARLKLPDYRVGLVAVDVEHADAAGQVAALALADDLEMHRIGALGVAENVEDAMVQPQRRAGLHMAAQLLAHADRRIGMADDGQRNIVERCRHGRRGHIVHHLHDLRHLAHPHKFTVLRRKSPRVTTTPSPRVRRAAPPASDGRGRCPAPDAPPRPIRSRH